MGGRKKKQPSFYQLRHIGLPRKQFLIQVNLVLKFEAKVCKMFCQVKKSKIYEGNQCTRSIKYNLEVKNRPPL